MNIIQATTFLIGLCLTIVGHAQTNAHSWHQSIPSINPHSNIAKAMQILGASHIGVIQLLQNQQVKGSADLTWQQAFTVIPASRERVMQAVLDFAHYQQTMPHVSKSELIKSTPPIWQAKYTLSFKMPIVHVKPVVVMQHQLLPNGDLVERAIDGDIRFSQSRWQFVALAPRRTLLIQTSAADIGSASWWLKLIFAAQPDFETLSPVNAAALTLQSLRQKLSHRFTSRYRSLPHRNLQECKERDFFKLLPIPDRQQREAIGHLTEQGPVSLVSPFYTLKHCHHHVGFQAVTTARLINRPKAAIKPLYTNIRHYPDSMEAIRKITNIKENQLHHRSHWQLGFDFSVFTFKIDYDVKGQWNQSRDGFSFISPRGDFRYLNGHLQWWEHSANKTVAMFVSAHDIDPEAGYILKLIARIPFNQMFSGVFIGRRLMDSQAQMLMGKTNTD